MVHMRLYRCNIIERALLMRIVLVIETVDISPCIATVSISSSYWEQLILSEIVFIVALFIYFIHDAPLVLEIQWQLWKTNVSIILRYEIIKKQQALHLWSKRSDSRMDVFHAKLLPRSTDNIENNSAEFVTMVTEHQWRRREPIENLPSIMLTMLLCVQLYCCVTKNIYTFIFRMYH